MNIYQCGEVLFLVNTSWAMVMCLGGISGTTSFAFVNRPQSVITRPRNGQNPHAMS